MTQQFYVSAGQKIKGPVVNKQRSTSKDGKVQFSGDPSRFYGSHDKDGKPIPLPSGIVEWLKSTNDSNGQSKLQNMIQGGVIVFEAGASSPVQFAPAMGVELTINPQGQITQDA
jgi:hypothetical protein